MIKRQYKLTPVEMKRFKALPAGDCHPEVHKFWRELGEARHFMYRTVSQVFKDGTFYAVSTLPKPYSR